MKKISLLSFLIFGFVTAANAAESFRPSIGVSGVFANRELSAQHSFSQFTPELVGYGYLPLQQDLWLRPGVRVGFAWNQPTMARSLRLNEYDFKTNAELGVVWSGPVVPSFSLGLGGLLRTTSLSSQSQINLDSSRVGKTRLYPYLQGQLGVGIPIEKGVLMLEPYVRYLHIFGDRRYQWASGLEFTLSLS